MPDIFWPCELLSSLFVRRPSSVRQHFTFESSPQKPLGQLYGGSDFQQTVGIPMVINCASLLADLFL
jgi:hypothetical protein